MGPKAIADERKVSCVLKDTVSGSRTNGISWNSRSKCVRLKCPRGGEIEWIGK